MEAATLTRIKGRFVGREAEVERAYGASESFRGLCWDYLSCVAAMARWRESPSTDAPGRSAEYAELVAELTAEIEAHLGRERAAMTRARRPCEGRDRAHESGLTAKNGGVEMQSRRSWRVLAVAPLALVAATAAAQSNEGVKQVDRLITASGRTVKAIADTKLQLVKTMDAYDALMARDAKDRKKLYDRLQKEMDRLESQRSKIADEAAKMQEQADALFDQWADSIAAIDSDDLRARSEERLAATRASYAEIEAAGQKAAGLYAPFLKDLQDQVTYLGHDLNAAAVASLEPEAKELGEKANRLVESIDATIATANEKTRALRPE